MFDSSVVSTEEKKFGPNKYITYGIQELKINKFEIKVAGTGTKGLVIYVEGRPVMDSGFEGVDGASGQIGKLTTFYMRPDQESDVIFMFGKIADALGVREKLDAIKSTSLEEYVEAINKVITGKFARFIVACVQEYNAEKGKTYNKLSFPRYNFVESLSVNPTKLVFDKDKSYHFKPAVIPSNIGTSDSATSVKQGTSDLPF